MAEEFQGGVCGGNLWNSWRNVFGLSPCSSNLGSFAPLENMVFPTAISDDHFRRSNHDLITDTKTSSHESGRSEEIYSHVLQESEGLNSNMNFCENSYTFIQQQPPNSFPLNTDSYSLLQTLFDTDFQTTNSSSSSLNYHMNSAEFSDSLAKVSPMVKPTLPTRQASNHLQFTNNTPIPWNHATFRASFVPSSLNSAKPNLHNFNAKRQNEEVGDLDSKKVSSKPVLKRPRVETPSPLPTFKVRKEKLGDRVTALQQLVSPFGKTDTASVLQEAIEYIKFLHDQVNTLSTPYLKDGSSPLQAADKIKDEEGRIRDLKSRGLCLVPISSTFPVAAETTTDFWTPTCGGSFR